MIREVRRVAWASIGRPSLRISLALLVAWAAFSRAGTRAEAWAQSPTEPHRILVFYGNAEIGVWEREFNEALLRNVRLADGVRVTLELASVELASEAERRAIAESLSAKVSSFEADLIVSIMPAAAQFVREWGDTFAPGVPAVYVLPGPEEAEYARRTGSAVALESAISEAAFRTVEAMPRMLPRLQHLFVVGSATETDLSYVERVRQGLDRAAPEFEVTYLIGLSPDELVDRLGAAPQNSAVLLSTYNMLSEDRRFWTSEIASHLGDHLAIPVFGLLDTLIGQGVVGGNVTSAPLYAERAMELSYAVLAGDTDMGAIPPPTAFVFDSRQLDRFGIRRGRLPEASTIVNESSPFWSEYLLETLLGLFVILTQAILIVALVRSLTKRRSAERQRDEQAVVTENQARLFSSVTNAISDAFVHVDAEGVVLTANRSGYESTFGGCVDDLIGQPVARLLCPPGRDPDGRCLPELSMEPTVRAFYRADGAAFSGEYVGAETTDVDGAPTGWFLLIRDVTERLRKEEERRQASKMEALGSLAGGIAHDFNNILMAISGSAELAGTRVGDTDFVADRLAKILTASDRAKKLVAQILTFSRRNEKEAMTKVDVHDLLVESVDLLGASLPKSLSIELSADTDLWSVSANATQLQQALMNLCSNAGHAMDQHGVVSIRATNEVVAAKRALVDAVMPTGNYVKVSVTDTGRGMTDDIKARVFEPFFTTKPPGEGTGMGLASVYGMAKAHGGYIDLYSSVGKGTSITLYLRAREGDAVVDEVPSTEGGSVRGQGQRILLVDDEEMVVDANGRILRHLGYEVVGHTSPKEALEVFESDPDGFALVVSDQSMPGMDGMTLLGHIDRVRPGTPTILWTGYLDAATKARAEGSVRPFAVLGKPSRVPVIAATVSAAISGTPQAAAHSV